MAPKSSQSNIESKAFCRQDEVRQVSVKLSDNRIETSQRHAYYRSLDITFIEAKPVESERERAVMTLKANGESRVSIIQSIYRAIARGATISEQLAVFLSGSSFCSKSIRFLIKELSWAITRVIDGSIGRSSA